MSRRFKVYVLVLGALTWAAPMATAQAQESGNDPYAVYPSPNDDAEGPSAGWFADEGVSLSTAELDRGAFNGRLQPVAAEGEASQRAGAQGGDVEPLLPLMVLALAGSLTFVLTRPSSSIRAMEA